MIERWTTAVFGMKFLNSAGTSYLNLENYTNRITFKDDYGTKVNLFNDRITFNDDLSITVTLTPTETSSFHGKRVTIETLMKDTSGNVTPSSKAIVPLQDTLEDSAV